MREFQYTVLNSSSSVNVFSVLGLQFTHVWEFRNIVKMKCPMPVVHPRDLLNNCILIAPFFLLPPSTQYTPNVSFHSLFCCSHSHLLLLLFITPLWILIFLSSSPSFPTPPPF